ncbi:MAG: hypothetical protein V3R87_12290 [Dehalococcoidia bacterium]
MALPQVYDKERDYVKGISFEAVASGEQPVFESGHFPPGRLIASAAASAPGIVYRGRFENPVGAC